jgi:iron complex outermembrane receptor protein
MNLIQMIILYTAFVYRQIILSNHFKSGVLEAGYQFRKLDYTGYFVYEKRTDFNDGFKLVPEFSSKVNLTRSIHAFYSQFSGKSGNWDYTDGATAEIMDRTLQFKDKANKIDETFDFDLKKIYPSASLKYSVSDKTNIKAAHSKRVEGTSTFQMNPFQEREHSETLEQGNQELKPEFINLFEVSINKKIKDGNSIFATGYYRNVKNVVNRVNTVYNDIILNRIYSNVDDAQAMDLN